MRTFITLLITAALAAALQPKKPRARDLGVPFEGTPGTNNAITDVAGVEVGFTTLIKGDGALIEGTGPVRTGVTAILPRGKSSNDPVIAGWFSLNGNGEMTGTTWIKESGFLEGPVFITNTHSVGVVRDASIAWRAEARRDAAAVVAARRRRDLGRRAQRHQRLSREARARVCGARRRDRRTGAEGNVGGGTGMICYGFKCGTGTASRKLDANAGGATPSACWCRRNSRTPERTAHRGRAGRRGDSRCRRRGAALRRSCSRSRAWLDHHRRRHRCAAAAASTRTHRAPRVARPRAHGRDIRQRLRGHLHRVLDRQRRSRPARRTWRRCQMLSNDRISALF